MIEEMSPCLIFVRVDIRIEPYVKIPVKMILKVFYVFDFRSKDEY